jgi:hypothetical protein
VLGIEDLLGLSSNPRMLSFIAQLDERRLRAVAGAGAGHTRPACRCGRCAGTAAG